MQTLNKKILIGLIFVSLYTFVVDFLKVLNIIAMTDSHAKTFNILFSLGIVIALGLLVKHKYWILACIFWGLNAVARILSALLFLVFHSVYNLPTLSIMIAGMICTLVSTYYFYSLSKVKEFDVSKNIRLDDLDDYLKKKFRSTK